MKYLIVGLGNIGPEYHETRHNIGFMVVDALAKLNNTPFVSGRYGSTASFSIKGQQLLLLKPSTFMNLSGLAVRYWMQEEKIPLENVLIVVDDIEKSIEFYKDLFGLQVILKNEGNVILSEGLVLQDADIWGKTLNETSTPFNNMMELYFEDFDIDGLLAKYESGKYFVRYATELTELAGGQKLVRLYDPSGNLIEVRTPFRCN